MISSTRQTVKDSGTFNQSTCLLGEWQQFFLHTWLLHVILLRASCYCFPHRCHLFSLNSFCFIYTAVACLLWEHKALPPQNSAHIMMTVHYKQRSFRQPHTFLEWQPLKGLQAVAAYKWLLARQSRPSQTAGATAYTILAKEKKEVSPGFSYCTAPGKS